MYYIGNSHSKELHYNYCPWVRLMSSEHKERYETLEEALAAKDYDPCGHCEPFERQTRAVAYESEFELVYQGGSADWSTNIPRGQPLELKADIEYKGTETSALAGKEVKFAIVYHAGREYPLGSAITDEKGEARLVHTFEDKISTCSVNLIAYFPNNVTPQSVTRHTNVADLVTEASFSPKNKTSGTTQFQFTLDTQASGRIQIYRRMFWFFWKRRKTLDWHFDEGGTKRVNWNGTDDSGKKMWGVFKAEIRADTWPIPGFDVIELRDIKRKR